MTRFDPRKSSETKHLKVQRLFQRIAGTRAESLKGGRFPERSFQIIRKVFQRELGKKKAAEFAFHMCDWNYDAAFMVAFHLFPEKFTPDEIRAGVVEAVGHAPNHMAAAAKLADNPVSDTWGLGALDGNPRIKQGKMLLQKAMKTHSQKSKKKRK